jgi:ribosomal protein S18 acetylase RimI-like enzyme
LKQHLVNLVYFYRPAALNLYGMSPRFSRAKNTVEMPLTEINESEIHNPILSQVASLAQCPIQDLRNRLQLGHQLFVQTEAKQMLGYFWFSRAGLIVPWEKRLNLLVGPNAAYIWDCRVAPEARNRGLYRSALVQICDLASDKVKDRIYIYCNKKNLASSRGIEGAGFQLLTTVNVRPLILKRALLKRDGKTLVVGPSISTEIFQSK